MKIFKRINNLFSRKLDRMNVESGYQESSFVETLARLKTSIENNGLPDYEKILEAQYTKWLEKGSVVYDVGAHTGRHLKEFIKLVGSDGKVLGFEPLPFAYDAIKKYRSANVDIFNIALGEFNGSSEFVHNETAPEESGLIERVYNNPHEAKPIKIQCIVKRLDDFCTDVTKIDFIKIDIEGGELGCLKGGVDCITKYRPLISVEYGFPSYSVYGHQKSSLYDFCEKVDYVLYDIYANSLHSRALWSLACDSVYWDFFMVPKEQKFEFERRMRRGIK